MPLFPQAHRALVMLWLLIVSTLIFLNCANSTTSLLLGIITALCFAPSALTLVHKSAGHLIKIAVILLGFNLPLHEVWQTTQQTWLASLLTIGTALLLGWILIRIFRIERDTGILLSVGTAICGGSAIAAVAPVIRARAQAIIVAISTVFLLNAAALLLFPIAGDWLALTPQQFGLWAALAIHDTSSVLGAAAMFDPQSVTLATTAKLARSLWIIPLVLLFAISEHRQNRLHWPWFIALFLLASLLRTMIPAVESVASILVPLSHQLFALALFGIGSQFSRATLQQISWKPFMMALILWLVLATISFLWVTR